LKALKNQLEKIDSKLSKLIKEYDEFKTKNDVIQSVLGVGNIVAFHLISDMPKLGCLTNKQASALVGVAPINR
jgi:transposase